MYVLSEDGVEIARTSDMNYVIKQIKIRKRLKIIDKIRELLCIIKEEDTVIFEEEFGWDTKYSLKQVKEAIENFNTTLEIAAKEKEEKEK